MSYKELLADHKAQKAEIEYLKYELSNLKRIIFGAKSEKFKTADSSYQGNLFDQGEEDKEVEEEPEEVKEVITYERTKGKKKHPGRNKLPSHLPVEEIIIEPHQDTTGLVKIGEQITETLDYTPASLTIRRIIRPKYAKKSGEGVLIGTLPSRPINKGIAEASLLAHIIVSKFVDHLPFYRQIQRFKRDYEWMVSSSTINAWFIACCTLLEPLYEVLEKQLLSSGYIQADESPIKVQDSNKATGIHQGYQWVYQSPEIKVVLFKYRKGRGMHGPKETLGLYQGYLQCDGYKVYDKIGKSPDIHLVGCLVHARRKFFEAKDNDHKRAEHVLLVFKLIYKHEKKTKEMSSNERGVYRNQHIRPLLLELRKWIDNQVLKVLPKSPIGKAMTYFVNQWPKLIAILDSGKLELDNNLIENKIRPLALGRKNYLFAGSHQAAQRIAMMYSFLATCKANDVNPFNWFKNTLQVIPDTKISQLFKLIPGYSDQNS